MLEVLVLADLRRCWIAVSSVPNFFYYFHFFSIFVFPYLSITNNCCYEVCDKYAVWIRPVNLFTAEAVIYIICRIKTQPF